MIRVLHSVSNMDRAGAETMLMNYYRHMDRSKVQFDFLCNKKKPGAYDAEIHELGGAIYRTPSLNPLKYTHYLKYMKNVFQNNPDYRIIETHNGALGAYALNAAKRNHIPVRICHAHGTGITRDLKLPLKLFCKAIIPQIVTRCFSCSETAARYYFGKKCAREKSYVFIPNAIEIDRFVFDAQTRNRIRQNNGLEGKHILGHVGRFAPEKNHRFLLEVFAHLKRRDPLAHLVLIGDGDEMEAVKQIASDLQIREDVSFLGNIGNVNEWYQAFDAFVLPSKREGLPVVGVEAQAADLPCIFSTGVTQEIKLLDKTYFMSLAEPAEKWAQAIYASFKDTQRTDTRKQIAEKGYDIRVEALKLQELYLELAGEHS